MPNKSPRGKMRDISSNKKNYTLIAGFISIFIGITVLIGWYLNIPFLKSVFPDLISMRTNAALSFILLGLSMVFLHSNKKAGVFIFGTLVSIISFLTLIEYVSGLDLKIDNLLLIITNTDALDSVFSNRMAIMTIINFILLGIGVILKFNYKKISDFISLFVFLNSFLAMMGYFFGIEEFYDIGGTKITPMALNTALLFMITSIGMIYKSINDGYFKILADKNTSSIYLKKIIILILILFPLIGSIAIKGKLANYYDWPLAFGLNQITISIIAIGFVYYFAVLLYNEETLKKNTLIQTLAQQEKHLEEMKQVQRTLEEKSKNLERMNKLMTGRELMMIKLKEEIADLKKTTQS